MKRYLDSAWRSALLTFLTVLVSLGAVGGAYLHYQKVERQESARSLAHAFAVRIVQRTNETIGPAYMLGSMVRQSGGNLAEFDRIAGELLEEFPLARALELAPGGVVRQVYPLRGNEAIVGHDLLKDRERNKEAHIALAKHQLMLAGPFELIQGGLGAVARYPVYLPGPNGKSVFWGFSIVLVRVPELLTNAGSLELERQGFQFQLCRLPFDRVADECKVFMQPAGGLAPAPVVVPVELPNAQWQLSVAPEEGWLAARDVLFVLVLVFALATLAAVLRFTLVRQQGESADVGIGKSAST